MWFINLEQSILEFTHPAQLIKLVENKVCAPRKSHICHISVKKCHMSFTNWIFNSICQANKSKINKQQTFHNYSKHIIVLLMVGSSINPKKTTIHYKKALSVVSGLVGLLFKKALLVWFCRLFFKDWIQYGILTHMLERNHQQTEFLSLNKSKLQVNISLKYFWNNFVSI